MTDSHFHTPQAHEGTDEIARVPDCPRCRSPMQTSDHYPHPRFPRVEIITFSCACGSAEKRVVRHKSNIG